MATFEGSKFQEPPFVLDTEDTKRAARQASVRWSELRLSDGEVEAVRKLESGSDVEVMQLLSDSGAARNLGSALLAVLQNANDASALQFALDMVERAIRPEVKFRAPLLFPVEAAGEEDLLSKDSDQENRGKGVKLHIRPFINLTKNKDPIVRGKASYLSALLLSVSGSHPDQEDLTKMMMNNVVNEIVSDEKSQPEFLVGLQVLSILLRSERLGLMFDARSGVNLLLSTFDLGFRSYGAEAQYLGILCIWLSCFNESAVARIDEAGLSTLVRFLRAEPRVRVSRLCLATIRIILENKENQEKLCKTAIEEKLPRILKTLSNKKDLKDQEMLADMNWLHDTLTKNFKVLTTFERHAQELLTKKLSKSMLHEELFWKEHAMKFEENNFSSVKKLIELLNSEDTETVCVACGDIGFFVQYYPNGKAIVEKYNGKAKIMSLIQSDNHDIQKAALTACSKILVSNWSGVN